MAYTPTTRLFVAPDLGAGASIDLPPEQAHYLGTVLRLSPGAVVTVFNGRDGEWSAELVALGKSGARLTLSVRRRAQDHPADLWLVFAPIKRARIDYLVEKATELGVAELLPVFTRHTTVERVNLDRLRAHAIEAAEQTERLTVPRLLDPQPLDRLLAAWPQERRLLCCDETGAAPSIGEVLATASPGPWAALTGPEGGFAETELDALRNLPFVCPVGLGPRVLRADTAALAAVAVFQALIGDWRQGRQR